MTREREEIIEVTLIIAVAFVLATVFAMVLDLIAFGRVI